ncbi:MAG TPA: YbhB/YbcL family Raf kinase inhibitor-like protein [Candidatus Hydrogenedentes bacterium]|nr:YbhB/YbcL family Raf kinase inhibitor-like protein [Candidatus Hydrogenedentota bacterium]
MASRSLFRAVTLVLFVFVPWLLFSCGKSDAKLESNNLSSSYTTTSGTTSVEGGDVVKIQLTSSAFKNGEKIPSKYTGDGENVSPPLAWQGAPQGTKSFALICDDPDAPVGTWVHWVIFNVPANTTELKEGIPATKELPDGTRQGLNDFLKVGYGGPAPPPGKPHRYFFRLYALDCVLNLKAECKKSELVKAMQGHILGSGELVGIYQR